MSDRINRREFIKRSAATGAGAGLTLGMSRRAEAAFDIRCAAARLIEQYNEVLQFA